MAHSLKVVPLVKPFSLVEEDPAGNRPSRSVGARNVRPAGISGELYLVRSPAHDLQFIRNGYIYPSGTAFGHELRLVETSSGQPSTVQRYRGHRIEVISVDDASHEPSYYFLQRRR